MDMLLRRFATMLSARGIGVLLIGGHALQAYGVVRQTLDVDWLAADDDAVALKAAMRELGYHPVAETRNFIRLRAETGSAIDVDVLLVDRSTFEALDQSARAQGEGPGAWRTPCALHMVALKLHAMRNDPKRASRDVADIVELLRAVGGEISDDDLLRVCRQYGPEGSYQRIAEQL